MNQWSVHAESNKSGLKVKGIPEIAEILTNFTKEMSIIEFKEINEILKNIKTKQIRLLFNHKKITNYLTC